MPEAGGHPRKSGLRVHYANKRSYPVSARNRYRATPMSPELKPAASLAARP